MAKDGDDCIEDDDVDDIDETVGIRGAMAYVGDARTTDVDKVMGCCCRTRGFSSTSTDCGLLHGTTILAFPVAPRLSQQRRSDLVETMGCGSGVFGWTCTRPNGPALSVVSPPNLDGSVAD